MKKNTNKLQRIKEYIKYYIGNLFFKLVYIDDVLFTNEDGDEDIQWGGYELRHRPISDFILTIIMLPLIIIKYIVYFIAFYLDNFFKCFIIHKSRIISNDKNLSKSKKVNIFNHLIGK